MQYLALVLLTLSSLIGYSQGNPEWVSSEYRERYYPQESYLLGYGEQWDVSKKDAESKLNYLISIAKGDLIESVKVNVKSVSTSQLADYNGEITDFFKNETESTSDLKIVGLRTEKHYNKKEKKAYAFVYANKSEVARYYSDEIMKSRSKVEQGIEESKALRNTNLFGAFSVLLANKKTFTQIEEAQTILLALGANSTVFLQKTEVNKLKTDFFKEFSLVKKDSQVSTEILSAIICEELKLSLNLKEKLNILEFSYQETGMTSEFSNQLKGALEQSFIQKTLFSVEGEGRFNLQGTYWNNNNHLEVKVRLRDSKNNQTVAFSNAFILKSTLDKSESNYTPKDIEKLKMLPHFEFVKLNDNLKGKAGFGIEKELKIKLKYKGVAKSEIPVIFYNNNGGAVYCENVLTNELGIASCRVKTISGKYKNQIIKAGIDVDNMISVSKDNEYYKKTMGNKEVPNVSIRVLVSPSIVSIDATELRFGNESKVKLVEPEIKEVLSGSGFKFSTDQGSSDYVIYIQASSRKGADLEGLHFAFVDVNLSVYANKEGKEIFKDSLTNFKGAGASYDQAASKAFYAAAKEAKYKIEEVLLK